VTASSYHPTSDYTPYVVRGWKVLVGNDLLANDRATAERCRELLDNKLYEISRIVPGNALEKIRGVRIWLEHDDPLFDGGVYHPSREWLVANGMNPDKAKAVEFGRAENFLGWSLDQPMLVLHELSHAYHDQVLGYDNPDVSAAYERAKTSGTYDAVLYRNGDRKKAYAMNDDHEYFAELSEAYFGMNDFFPFVRAEVQQHDPQMFELLEKVWSM
jgi:hypothetical protein